MTSLFRSVCLAGLCLAVLGCGKDPAYKGEARIPLSGRVTLDGASIDGGTISFIPQSQGKRVAGGPIMNGMYSIPENHGVHAGPYRVEIRCPKPIAPGFSKGKKIVTEYRDPDTGEMKPVVQESIPAKFNTQSTLSTNITPEQPALDFDLTSK